MSKTNLGAWISEPTWYKISGITLPNGVKAAYSEYVPLVKREGRGKSAKAERDYSAERANLSALMARNVGREVDESLRKAIATAAGMSAAEKKTDRIAEKVERILGPGAPYRLTTAGRGQPYRIEGTIEALLG
jgi:hypothetical protein